MIRTRSFRSSLGMTRGSGNAASPARLRLARYFNTDPGLWLNLQNFIDLEIEKRSGTAVEIERHVHPAAVEAP